MDGVPLQGITETGYIGFMLKRTVYVLNLLKEDQPVTAVALAESLGVSERTIRYDIAQLNKEGISNGYTILSLPRYGYVLNVNNRIAFNEFRKDNRPDMIPVEPDDRFGYLATLLLVRSHGISLRQIEDELIISNSTAKNVLREVSAELRKYHISVRLKNGIYTLSGNEENIRMCLADTMIRYRVFRYYRNFDMIRFRKIRRRIFTLMSEYDIHLPVVSFNHFQIYLFIDITRDYNGKKLTSDWIETISSCKESDFIEQIAVYIRSECSISLNRIEKKLLTMRLLGLNMDYQNRRTGNPDHTQMIEDTFAEILKVYDLDFSADPDIREALASHMASLVFRIRYHTLMQNPLKDEVRQRYSLAWNMAAILSDKLTLKYGKEVYDEEKAYLAILFQSAIERTSVRNKKRVLLVSGLTPGTVHYLKTQILTSFERYIDQIDCDDSTHIYAADLTGYDVIFSTVDLDRKTDIPVIRLNDFLDDTGMKRLRVYFEQKRS